ncbi:MAG: DUF6908 domain-containing protein [Bradymonadia bacterium]
MTNFLFGDEGITQVSDVLKALTDGLKEGQGIKFDNSDGVYMAVYVNRLTEHRFSVAHYFLQNGDMCSDPDMEFIYIEATDAWLPVSFSRSIPPYFQEALELDGADRPVRFRPIAVEEQCDFTKMWMANIREQQGGVEAIREAVREALEGA